MAKSRARQQGEDVTRTSRMLERAQQKKEKEDNDFRVNGLRVLGLVSKMRSRMLPEEVTMIRAIMEQYTRPIDNVAWLKPNAIANLVESGDLVEDQKWDEEPEMSALPSIEDLRGTAPCDLRNEVVTALLAQGFKKSAINDAANKLSWSNGESFDQKLRSMLTSLRPTERPTNQGTSNNPRFVDSGPEQDSEAVAAEPTADPAVTLPPTIPQRVKAVSA
ncbi:hypothetical protein [Occallatibacter savannae]|uniref:hypothetical protein n=1 Tax=Occallatibacter savannae TaxID=1002691 RepID=UPI0013A57BD0|nr:hypothetical protein [Occallatibacter savannae]